MVESGIHLILHVESLERRTEGIVADGDVEPLVGALAACLAEVGKRQ